MSVRNLHRFFKILDLPAFERQLCFERLDRMVKQLNWHTFPGLVPLLLKGTVCPSAYEQSIGVLIKCIPLLDQPIVEGGKGDAFALIFVAILPHLLLHFDCPTTLCVSAADAIVQV